MNYLSLGSAPVSESCAQLGEPEYEARARAECRALIGQLQRLYEARHGHTLPCQLFVKGQLHDFGTYFEVSAKFIEEAVSQEAVYWLEAHLPENWDEEALREIHV